MVIRQLLFSRVYYKFVDLSQAPNVTVVTATTMLLLAGPETPSVGGTCPLPPLPNSCGVSWQSVRSALEPGVLLAA